MIRPAPLLIAFALGVAACSGAVEPVTSAQLGEAFWIRVAEPLAVPDARLVVRFVEVLEDSRCPNDPLIQCIWAGRVRIRIGLTTLGGVESLHELRFLDQPSAVIVGSYHVELLDITPLPTADLPPRNGYRAQLRVVEVSSP